MYKKLDKKIDEVNEPETIHEHTEVKTVTVIEKEIEVPVFVAPPQPVYVAVQPPAIGQQVQVP